MRPTILLAALVLAVAAIAWGVRRHGRDDGAAIVLCGGSMRPPVAALAGMWSDLPLRVDYGGSETLLPRVLAGEAADVLVVHAPFDERLAAAGRLAARVEVGRLVPVLLTRQGNPKQIRGLEGLAAPGVRLALPDPRYSTCGELLLAELDRRGLRAAVAANTVVEQRTHQELATQVRLGGVDAAVVWRFAAVALAGELAFSELPADWPAVPVAVCRLAGTPHPAAADAILARCAAPEGRAVFAAHGY